jgi:hypothetical protein
MGQYADDIMDGLVCESCGEWVDIAAFIAERRAVATGLRRDAQTMMRRAEQIEEECDAWRNALQEAP